MPDLPPETESSEAGTPQAPQALQTQQALHVLQVTVVKARYTRLIQQKVEAPQALKLL